LRLGLSLTCRDAAKAIDFYKKAFGAQELMRMPSPDGSKVSHMPMQDMFWGDRFGKVTDPFGHKWGLAMHIEDVAPEEIGRRAKEFFAKAAGQNK
jgi:uncharacterized glyoxalase superfamily protein PhnB